MTETVDRPGRSTEMDFDHWSSKVAFDPYDTWARLRNECPVAHTPRHGGFYVLSRYDDVFEAALDTTVFSSDGGGAGVAIPSQEMQLAPIEADPPIHTEYRQLLNPFFSMRRVAAMEDKIRELAREFISRFPQEGSFDIAAAFTLPLPRLVGFTMLEFPEELHDEVADAVMAIMDEADDRQGDGPANLFRLLSGILNERREKPRGDDILDAVVFAEIDGRPVTEMESFSMLVLLLMGGLSTTSAAIAAMIQWLGDHPEDVERLRAEPEIHKYAIEEFVRWSTPVSHIGRTAMEDAEIDGCPIPKGSRVLLGFGSANRDERAFPRPEEVIVDRQPNRHAGFGIGPHRCIGSHLAKLQIRIALEELLAAMPPFNVDHSQIHWKGGETRLMDRLVVNIEGNK